MNSKTRKPNYKMSNIQIVAESKKKKKIVRVEAVDFSTHAPRIRENY